MKPSSAKIMSESDNNQQIKERRQMIGDCINLMHSSKESNAVHQEEERGESAVQKQSEQDNMFEIFAASEATIQIQNDRRIDSNGDKDFPRLNSYSDTVKGL